MQHYDHRAIERKWQERWEREGAWRAEDNAPRKDYLLIEFPYPSGDGLHVGHPRPYIALDVVARKRRAEGHNVLYPIGWDAFGLPTESYALKTGIHPAEITKKNTDNFRRQIKSLGISFDWSREINTADPTYYKWTQWIFLQLFKRGLAYKARTTINWCPSCKIGLANEEVMDGRCERCDTPVEKREKEQWMLAITKYAKRLYDDLDTVDYIEAAKLGQRNWIGPSEGASIKFQVSSSKQEIEIFTTRPDTLFGATYLVLAPEHPLVTELIMRVENKKEILQYIEVSKKKTEIERTAEGKEKTGVELKGVKAINPANKEEIPIFVADYVLASYGTGAIMAVPAHDERDFAFAKKFNLPIRPVVLPRFVDAKNPPVAGKENTFRKTILGVVYDPKQDKYLCLLWKKQPWVTFISGGIEKGEDVATAARREIEEETGYTDLKFVRAMEVSAHSEFFARHKNVNRMIQGTTVLFELQSDKRRAVSTEEAAKYNTGWLSQEEIGKNQKMAHAELAYVLDFVKNGNKSYTGPGVLTNSGQFDGMNSEEAKKKIIEFVGGEWKTVYKLHDWVFSRQRYWGEPIPMIKCEKCGWQPVPEEQLPVVLPEVEKYQPSDTGESPLANIIEWINTTCPKCGGKAKRETDVMPNWAGSSWYYLRYCDPHNDKELASKEKLTYWTPVDWYNGGMEHTTLHLLYSRFWHKFLFDIGVVPTPEPYQKRTSHGLILAEDGRKMSKSLGNVINPDSIVESHGADALRLYEMFIGPFDQSVTWSTASIAGVRRFLERVWKLKVGSQKPEAELDTLVHKTVKKVSEDIEHLKMNTAVSALMIVLNEFEKLEMVSKDSYTVFLRLLAPLAPHIAHELAERNNIVPTEWPKADGAKLASGSVTVAVQVNGKVRASLELPAQATQEQALAAARAHPAVEKWLKGGKEKKIIYVPGKIINLVVDGLDKP